MKFNIYAVGSNKFLAQEIKDAVRLIVGPDIPVFTCLGGDIINCLDGILYVCNQSQFAKLEPFIPRDRIVVLNLMPTSQFYVQVAAIPAGKDVYVFNNKMSYIATLIESCKSMGITGVRYIPLPYSELPDQEVFEMLKKAQYIIGVDYLLNDNVLLSEKYIGHLHYNTVRIGAKRVGAVSSACEIVFKVNHSLYQAVTGKLTNFIDMLEGIDDTQSLYELYQKLSVIFKDLEEAAGKSNSIEKSMINQIAPKPLFPSPRDDSDFADT